MCGGADMPLKPLLVASVMLLLAQVGDGFAADSAGAFDGKWTGSATSTAKQCKSAKVAVSVEGPMVIGQAQFADDDAPNNINGTIRGDGTFGATIGWQPLRVRLETSARITKLSQHEADGREFQEGKGAAVEIFPVLGETAATVEPRNRAFDDPTLG